MNHESKDPLTDWNEEVNSIMGFIIVIIIGLGCAFWIILGYYFISWISSFL